MTTPHRRRWFAFSLRTMFVGVTLVCIWLGWQLHVVRKRADLLKWCDDNAPAQVITATQVQEHFNRRRICWVDAAIAPYQGQPNVPWIRRALGDNAIMKLEFWIRPTAIKEAELREWFPETDLVFGNLEFSGVELVVPPAE